MQHLLLIERIEPTSQTVAHDHTILLAAHAISSRYTMPSFHASLSMLDPPIDGVVAQSTNDKHKMTAVSVGRLEELKRREAELISLLDALRAEKIGEVKKSPLTIGVVGFGNFGQFLARTFVKHANVVGTSRGDYTEPAKEMGASFIPQSELERFLSEVDVVIFAVAINCFENMLKTFLPSIEKDMQRRIDENIQGILFVDVCSVKEYPRKVMLDLLPEGCDILCTHPMFGPISGANGWGGLRFIYEKTRVNRKLLNYPHGDVGSNNRKGRMSFAMKRMVSTRRVIMSQDVAEEEENDLSKLGMDRIERFLSIWEEEGCHMVAMSCKEHDMHAAKSQFVTHLIGRVLGQQGLEPTPVDTKGFESVLGVVNSVTSDSYDLFEGLYKYNAYSPDVIRDLRQAMDHIEQKLKGKGQVDSQC